MNPRSNQIEQLEAGPTAGNESGNKASGEQSSILVKRSATKLKALRMAGVVIAAALAVYFLAISPRIETEKELTSAAAAAGKKTVIVVAPTQTASAPELTLPGNIAANQMASIY